jgi:hypothetical protein
MCTGVSGKEGAPAAPGEKEGGGVISDKAIEVRGTFTHLRL